MKRDNPDELLLGAKAFAAEIFSTDQPTNSQVRMVSYWLNRKPPVLKAAKFGLQWGCTRRNLRTQIDSSGQVAA